MGPYQWPVPDLMTQTSCRVQLRASASVGGLRVMASQREVISAEEAQKRMQNGWKYLDVR